MNMRLWVELGGNLIFLQDTFFSAHDLKRARDTKESSKKFSWGSKVMLGFALILWTNLDMNMVFSMPLLILLYGFLYMPENASCNSPNHKKAFLTAVSKTVGGG